jgi:proteasome accessory factor A
LVAAWAEVLNDLEADPLRCRDRLDWVAKHALLREFQEAQNLRADDPWFQSLDLEYHRLDPAEGLYFGIEETGAMRGVPPPAEVERAMRNPPDNTRAAVRGRCIAKFGSAVIAAQWDHVTLATSKGPLRIDLTDLFAPARLRAVMEAVEIAATPDDLHFPPSS